MSKLSVDISTGMIIRLMTIEKLVDQLCDDRIRDTDKQALRDRISELRSAVCSELFALTQVHRVDKDSNQLELKVGK